MRYIKVLLLVLIFFISMVFFFQNQQVLSQEMKLKLNLFFTAPYESISLPFYFLLLAAFLVGSLVTFLLLIWDRMHISARHMKASWRLRTVEKELAALKAAHADHVKNDTTPPVSAKEETPQALPAEQTPPPPAENTKA